MQNSGESQHDGRTQRRDEATRGDGAGRAQPSTNGSGPSAAPVRDADEPKRAEIQDNSDQLLAAVDEIRRLEVEKRRVRMSTPEFHRTAEQIERKARAVFGIARAQREVGDMLSENQPKSIDDQAASENDPPDERDDQ